MGALGRAAAVVVVLATALVAAAGPALAIGAQGVDLRPLLERRDGTLTAVVADGATTIGIRLTNDSGAVRQVSVRATAVEEADGQPRLGADVAWLTVPDGGAITLAAGEVRELEAVVDPEGFLQAGAGEVALVLSVEGDGNVVTQAATVIAVDDGGATLPRPVEVILAAVVLLAVVASALVVVSRLQGHEVRSVWQLRRRRVPGTA